MDNSIADIDSATMLDTDLPELKRAQSVKQMIKSYRQQKLTIKSALDNLDRKPVNKIVFEDDYNFSDKLNSSKEESKKNKSLFHSDDEDEENFNFDFKDQFTGKDGQQLFELQSKFKGDKRFNLDERFIESDGKDTEGPTLPSAELSLEEEKKNAIGILQEVLGTKVKSSKHQEGSLEKHMLRYDPTQSHHRQYEIQAKDTTKTNKKQRKHVKEQENQENDSNEQPHVSNDVFYKVSDNLKNTFQSNQEFSLLKSFNSHVEKENGHQMKEQSIAIENREKLYLENNPFVYDSSEDEAESIQETNKCSGDYQPEVKFFSEPFFFRHDDFRLQEGSDFVRRIASENNSEFTQQRRNFKHVVKSKVRNNTRKNNPFKKKLGGSKKRKIFKIKKALKR